MQDLEKWEWQALREDFDLEYRREISFGHNFSRIIFLALLALCVFIAFVTAAAVWISATVLVLALTVLNESVLNADRRQAALACRRVMEAGKIAGEIADLRRLFDSENRR